MNLANTGGGIYPQWFCSATHNLGQYQPHRNGGFVQPFCYNCFGFYSCEMFEAQFFGLVRGTLTDSGPSPSKTIFLVFDLEISVKLLTWRMLLHFTKLRCLPSLCEQILPSKKEMSLSGCIEKIKVPFHEILGGLWIPRKTTKSM